MAGISEMTFRPSMYGISGTTGFRVVGAGTGTGTGAGTGTRTGTGIGTGAGTGTGAIVFERWELLQNRNIATISEALSYVFLGLHKVGRRLTF